MLTANLSIQIAKKLMPVNSSFELDFVMQTPFAWKENKNSSLSHTGQ